MERNAKKGGGGETLDFKKGLSPILAAPAAAAAIAAAAAAAFVFRAHPKTRARSPVLFAQSKSLSKTKETEGDRTSNSER